MFLQRSKVVSMSVIDKLEQLRRFRGQRRTTGLDDETIQCFAANDPQLQRAVDQALSAVVVIKAEFPELLELDESIQIEQIQQGFLNFYQRDAINPYVALGAAGPWLARLRRRAMRCGGIRQATYAAPGTIYYSLTVTS